MLPTLREGLATYEEIRELLAADLLDLEIPAGALADSLERAGETISGEDPTRSLLGETAAAARSLASASDLGAARKAFAELNRLFVPLVGSSPELREGRFVFECPMIETFSKWIQPSPEPRNPYMGPDMLACSLPTDWGSPAPSTAAEARAHAAVAHGDGVAYWTCAMHPSVRSEEPGRCPICSMDLTPVTREELDSGVVRIDSQRRQAIGVRTAPVEVRSLAGEVTAPGEVVADESRLAEVTLKNRGWIERLHVDETGREIRRGQTLLTLYSPELLAAQEELLAALASRERARSTTAPERADYLVDAARRRLRLWDLTEEQIDRIAATGQPLVHLPIPSPVSGHVLEKLVVEGAAVQPGQTLFRVAALDRVWVEAQVYEADLALVQVGGPATVTLPALPGRRFEGEVTFVSPVLRGATRTGTVRVELANPELLLKPEMFANVVLSAAGGDAVPVVPVEAVIYAGPRRLVFVDLGEGRLQPREVEVGRRAGDAFEVLSGLEPGDQVVVSGNFLVAAESRLKSAAESW